MYKCLILIIVLTFSVRVSAQKNSAKKDTVDKSDKRTDSEFDLKNYKSDPGDRLIFEINHTGWLGLPSDVKQYMFKSIGFNFSVMFDKPIGNSPFSFGYGFGIFSHNFHGNSEFVYHLDSTNSQFITKLEPYKRDISLNRYAQKLLEIPIEFRFRTKTDRQFKIHVGGKVGYVLNDFRSVRDSEGKVRVYDIKNINPLRYGVNFRIGFEQFAITASYYFTEIFKKDKGVNGITPYSVGIAIIPY